MIKLQLRQANLKDNGEKKERRNSCRYLIPGELGDSFGRPVLGDICGKHRP